MSIIRGTRRHPVVGLRRFACLASVCIAGSLVAAHTAGAATFTVDTNDDSGSGSLREAITEADRTPAADQIEFSPDLSQTLALASPLPVITAPLSVHGPGASRLTLSGGGQTGLVSIQLPAIGQVRISGLSMRGGSAADGGAVGSFGADVVLEHTVISDNEATNSGGALSVSRGSLTLRNSRLRANSARFAGGAVQLYNAGMTVVHSEISSSTAGASGGGIGVANPLGPLAIERSRINGNRAAGNGGGVSVTGSPVQPLTIATSELTRNEVAGDGGGIATVGSRQPVLIGAKIEKNQSAGRGPDVFPAILDPAPRKSHPRSRLAASKPSASQRKAASAGPAEGELPPATISSGPGGAPVSAATLLGGVAFAPPDAPTRVKAVIDAANFISRTPYVWGGGHASFYSNGYDCSGAVSFALFGGGFLDSPLASGGFETWGASGPGKWITVYASAGHAYAMIAGRRWDTVGDAHGSGPRWHLAGASPTGFVARHPVGY